MAFLETLIKIAVYAVMAVTIVAAIGVVTLHNLFHSALALVGVLLGIAGVYLALQADFLAGIQVLIYVGAVMTLVIYAIMLTQRLGDKNIPQTNRQGFAAAIVTLLLLYLLIGTVCRTPWLANPPARHIPASALDLGQALMTTYVFPFEAISVILIAALIGAIVIAKKEREP
ncbi:MAG: NADH-quinone oxidoreductase subunit J [Candidatus Omnitrophica bacterium]|nr:NADH-quinone oxidoreductase subunit J [Candidatus Omnitrophota bacterium]